MTQTTTPISSIDIACANLFAPDLMVIDATPALVDRLRATFEAMRTNGLDFAGFAFDGRFMALESADEADDEVVEIGGDRYVAFGADYAISDPVIRLTSDGEMFVDFEVDDGDSQISCRMAFDLDPSAGSS